jgi:hypothetical protein
MTSAALEKMAESASPTMRANIQAALAGPRPPAGPAAPPPSAEKPKTRMPAAKKVSKTEAAYGELLRREFPGKIIRNQDWTARLLSGVRYTPDFTVWDGSTLLLCVEVKGSYRLGSAADSRTRFLTAAVDFPEVQWRHVQKTADGWTVQTPPPTKKSTP